jgi:hypothetical protein
MHKKYAKIYKNYIRNYKNLHTKVCKRNTYKNLHKICIFLSRKYIMFIKIPPVGRAET